MKVIFDGGPLDGRTEESDCYVTAPGGIIVAADGTDPSCAACGGAGVGHWVDQHGVADPELFRCQRCDETGVEPGTVTLTYVLQHGTWPGPMVYRVVDLPLTSP